jgi:multimeric flavodoxin WrbA
MKALLVNCGPVRDGATAEIIRMIAASVSAKYTVKSVCIGDYAIRFCTGCRSCHETAECALPPDGVTALMAEIAAADAVICVSPSYWAEIPAQFKAFIDRCTPWSNTHEPHRTVPGGKRGYAAALRTGLNPAECERITGSLAHFYGHLGIPCCGRLCLTGVENKADVSGKTDEILRFCEKINGE